MLIRRGFPLMPMVAAGVIAGVSAFTVAGVTDQPASAASAPVPHHTASTSTVPVELPPAGRATTTAPTAPVATSVPERSAPPEAATRSGLVVQAVGDVNFDPTYITNFVEHGYDFAFEGLGGTFTTDDLTVINLECPPTAAGGQVDKSFSFACDPDAMPVLAAQGVEVANLANNHGQDRGPEGMLDSMEVLREAGIAPVGVGADIGEATTPAQFRVGGWTVAVLGMGGVVPGDGWLATADRPGMASGDDLDQMVSAVERAADQADIVIVTIHWGRELVSEPDPGDRERAAAMVEAGADMIFGHHPHRLGELELVDGVPVYWTLGNFIWPRLSDAGATTAIARVEVAPDGSVVACLVDAFIEESGRPELRADPACEAP
jgi:Bacterial capsule synthesis protein PGA_cap